MTHRERTVVALLFVALFASGCTRAPSDLRAGAHAENPTRDASVKTAEVEHGEPHAVDASAPGVDFVDEVMTIALADAPTVTLRTVDGVFIEVSLGSEPRPWKKIEIERRRENGKSGAVVQRDTFEHGAGVPSPRVHSAIAGSTYGYRARTSGAWSPEVTLHVPAPSAPPRAPMSLTARAKSPFSVRLAWESSARSVAGFELELKVNGVFVRAALLDPNERAYEHHYRLPGQTLEYRVRSFNARGASAPTAVAAITTPGMEGPANPPATGACVPAVKKPPPSTGCNPKLETLTGATGNIVSNVPSGGDGCARRLMGKYKGCTREFGVFTFQADVVVVPGYDTEGWPLLHAVAGAGQYVGANLKTLGFSGGRYTIVDDAHVCGDSRNDSEDATTGIVSDDIRACAPPFDDCQRDPVSL